MKIDRRKDLHKGPIEAFSTVRLLAQAVVRAALGDRRPKKEAR